MPPLEENFLRAVKDYTAGDPMRPDVKWTNLTLGQIAERPAEAGTPVSVTAVEQLLRNHRYIKRKAHKSRSMGRHADRTGSSRPSPGSSRSIWRRRTRS